MAKQMIIAKEYAFMNEQRGELVPMVFVGPEELVTTKYGGMRMGVKKATQAVEWGIFTPAVSKKVKDAAAKAGKLKKVKELK